MDRRSLAPALGFAAALLLPSLVVLDKYAGLAGVLVYVVAGGAALVALHRGALERLASGLIGRHAKLLAAAVAIALVVAFAIGYPLANSGLIGPGSDRDEHLQMGATELLQGRYPYYQIGPEPYDSIISQMPGALLLAVPFVLLGHGSYANFFWLAVFAAAASWRLGGFRYGLVLLLAILGLAPIVINEFVIGGDLLSNAIYVTVFMVALVERVPRTDAPAWQKILAAIAFGIGLSSRGQFLLLLPLVYRTLERRTDSRTALAYTAGVIATAAAVTLPFYLYDPPAFTPLETAGFLQSDFLPSWWRWVMVGGCAAVAVLCALDRRAGDLQVLLRWSTFVLALPIVIAAALRSYDLGTPDLGMLGYGLSFLFAGALGFAPRGAK